MIKILEFYVTYPSFQMMKNNFSSNNGDAHVGHIKHVCGASAGCWALDVRCLLEACFLFHSGPDAAKQPALPAAESAPAGNGPWVQCLLLSSAGHTAGGPSGGPSFLCCLASLPPPLQ